MRTFLAAALLATLGLPALAQNAHHAMPRNAADFVDVVPATPAPSASGLHVDGTSPHLARDTHPCLWGTVACTY